MDSLLILTWHGMNMPAAGRGDSSPGKLLLKGPLRPAVLAGDEEGMWGTHPEPPESPCKLPALQARLTPSQQGLHNWGEKPDSFWPDTSNWGLPGGKQEGNGPWQPLLEDPKALHRDEGFAAPGPTGKLAH